MINSNLSEDYIKPFHVTSSKRKEVMSRMGERSKTEDSMGRPEKIINEPLYAFLPPYNPKIPNFKISETDFLTARVSLSPDHSNNLLSLNAKETETQTRASKIKRTLIIQLKKYFKNSTFHGLRYIGDSQFTLGARIFWFFSFSLAFGFAAYFISNIYTKWKSSPVIISYNPFEADLDTIPFPAVTICNMNRAKKNEAEKILKYGSIIENKLLDDTCDGNSTFSNVENIPWETLRDFLIRVGNSCSDLMRLCIWGGKKVNCDDIFNNELTDEGLCCSFNRLPPEKIYHNWKDVNILNQTFSNKVYDWNAEKGFTYDVDDEYIPRRPMGSGPSMGLSVIVDSQLDNYYCSSTRSNGFKVMLSSPVESPKVADFGFLVGPGFANRVFIEPLVREATSSLRNIAVEKRQCYFTGERPLQYYRSYTQRNCLLECESMYVLKLCKCVPYYLPKNKYIKYCSKREKDCIEQAKIYMETVNTDGYMSCQCLPACFAVKFPYGKSMNYLYETVHEDLPNITAKYFQSNLAIMDFFFYRTKFNSELKSELFGFSEILSNTGGLLSLFLGFSFLSLVEVIYFVSLRVVCIIARHRVKISKRKRVTPQFSK